MDDEISVKCTKCGQSHFQFSLKLLKVTNQVECKCWECGGMVRILLEEDKITIEAH